MRIRDLHGWPPRTFATAREPHRRYSPRAELRLESVKHLAGSLVLTFADGRRRRACTTRVKVKDSKTAQLAKVVLAKCLGLTLEQLGLVMMHSESALFDPTLPIFDLRVSRRHRT